MTPVKYFNTLATRSAAPSTSPMKALVAPSAVRNAGSSGKMASLDASWLGPLVPAWRDLLGRPGWLTDGASLFYVSYYFIPFGMCIALWVQGRWKDFDDLGFVLIATLLLSYVGYFLVPTTGPRVPLELEVQVLGPDAHDHVGALTDHRAG